jgi:hypothetical protein
MASIDVSSFAQLPPPLLTVYLDTNPGERDNQKQTPGYLSWLKNQAKLNAREVPQAERMLFREQVRRIEKFLRDQASHPRALVIFAGAATWEQVSLGLPVHNELHWGKPALFQLLGIIDEHRPCCVVAVDRAGARFFRYHLGELAEFPEKKFHIDISQWKMKDHAHMARRGTRMPYGPQRDAFKSRVDAEYRHLCRQVAERTKRLCASECLLSIFLVGSKRLIEPIESQLPRELRGRVVLVDEDLARIPGSDLQKYLEPRIVAQAQTLMKRRVDDLLEREHGSVVGFDETLAQLQDGSISTVVLVRGLDTILSRCLGCGMMNRSADPLCVSCGSRREHVMLSEALPEMARANQTEIEVVSAEAGARLIKSGGIGGWLRRPRQSHETSTAAAQILPDRL